MRIFPAGTQVRVLRHPHAEVGQMYTIIEPGLAVGGYAKHKDGVDWHHFSPSEVEVVSQHGTKTRIHVLAWGVPESSAGFDWSPVDRDPGGERYLRAMFDNAIDDKFEGYAVLAELWVEGYAPDAAGRQRVTDLIEGELQDAIGAGRVGKILGRY